MKLATALSKSILWRGFYFLSVMLLNILVARHFQSMGSGQLYYVINLFAFALILISVCIEAPMGYYLSQKKLNETQLALLSLCWTFIIMIPVYFIVRSFNNSHAVELLNDNFKFSATVFLSGNLLITFFIALFYAKLDFVLPNLLLVAVNICLVVLLPNNELVSKFISDEFYLRVYFLGFLVQGILLAISFLIRYFKTQDIKWMPKEIVKPFFKFAFIAVATNSMTFLMYRIDYWFVNKYCTDNDLGNYIQACKLAQLYFIIPSILAAVVFPMTASGRREEMNEKMQLLSRGLIFFYTISCVTLAAIGYWVFPFVFGTSFNNMFWPFLLLIPAILAYSVIHLLAAYYSGTRELKINFRGNVIALAVIIIGDILVIPLYGIKGAALVSSIGYICYMSYMLLVHTREYKTKFSDFLFFRKSDAQLMYKLICDKLVSPKNEDQ